MTHVRIIRKEEALLEILQMADMILNESQEPAVRIRLLRDIFECSDQEFEAERELLEDTEKVRLLTASLGVSHQNSVGWVRLAKIRIHDWYAQ